MSKENVVPFGKAIHDKEDLKKRIAQSAETVDAWVKIAHDAGFEFTAEEFASVVGTTLGRLVDTPHPVREYRVAQRQLGSLELSEKTQAAVLGGRRFMATN